MAKTRRARIDAENDHRRVTRPRLRIIVKDTQGYPTGYLRASSDTIQHGPESRKVVYDEAIIPGGLKKSHGALLLVPSLVMGDSPSSSFACSALVSTSQMGMGDSPSSSHRPRQGHCCVQVACV